MIRISISKKCFHHKNKKWSIESEENEHKNKIFIQILRFFMLQYVIYLKRSTISKIFAFVHKCDTRRIQFRSRSPIITRILVRFCQWRLLSILWWKKHLLKNLSCTLLINLIFKSMEPDFILTFFNVSFIASSSNFFSTYNEITFTSLENKEERNVIQEMQTLLTSLTHFIIASWCPNKVIPIFVRWSSLNSLTEVGRIQLRINISTYSDACGSSISAFSKNSFQCTKIQKLIKYKNSEILSLRMICIFCFWGLETCRLIIAYDERK